MRVSSKTRNLVVRALAASFDVHTMNQVVRLVVRDYDIHERSGFPVSMSIPGRDAAKQIVSDFLEWNRIVELVQLLARISRSGLAGRTYRIAELQALILAIEELGYQFEWSSCTFFEDARRTKTRNWGVLEDNVTYMLTLLRIDIVGNSRLVKDYPEDVIQRTYSDLRRMFREITESRNGRVWNWEGDGATAAFYGGDTQMAATLCGVELMHQLFFYNALSCRLESDLQIRCAVHHGPVEYHQLYEQIKGPTMTTLVDIESRYCAPQSMCLSEMVYTGLNNALVRWMSPVESHESMPLYQYSLRLGA
ncbi:MAG: hypothetical protein ACLFNQ_10255 [Spirochaetaceae bacterium]